MIIQRLVLLTCLFMLCSCAPASKPLGNPEQPYPPEREAQVGDILHLPTGIYVSSQTLLSNVTNYRVVFVGETHDNPASHRLQQEVLQALQKHNRGQITLAMEMFTPAQQPILDLWSAGELSEKDFLQQVDWYNTWRINFAFYRPLLNYCRDQHIKILALNAEADLKQKVSRTPFTQLSTQDQAKLPDLDEQDPYQRAMAEAVFADHKMGSGMLDGFLRVQTLWDESMAENLANYLKDKRHNHQVMVMAGGNHIRYGYGIPRRMFRRLPVSYILIGSEEIDIPEHKRAQLMDIKKPDYPMIPYEYILYTRYEDLAVPGVKMGIAFEPTSVGILVKKVMSGSAAEVAGLKPEDVLLQLDGEMLNEVFDLTYALQHKHIGDTAILTLKRNGHTLEIEITFSEQTQNVHGAKQNK